MPKDNLDKAARHTQDSRAGDEKKPICYIGRNGWLKRGRQWVREEIGESSPADFSAIVDRHIDADEWAEQLAQALAAEEVVYFQGEEVARKPDWKTRLVAIVIYRDTRWGRPVERSESVNVNLTGEDAINRMMQSAAMRTSLAQVAAELAADVSDNGQVAKPDNG